MHVRVAPRFVKLDDRGQARARTVGTAMVEGFPAACWWLQRSSTWSRSSTMLCLLLRRFSLLGEFSAAWARWRSADVPGRQRSMPRPSPRYGGLASGQRKASMPVRAIFGARDSSCFCPLLGFQLRRISSLLIPHPSVDCAAMATGDGGVVLWLSIIHPVVYSCSLVYSINSPYRYSTTAVPGT